MGYVRHHAIIVTSFDVTKLTEAHCKAMELFTVTIGGCPQSPFVTEVVSSPVNRIFSFMVAPDGSNEGWEPSQHCDDLRANFKGWLREQAYEDGSSSLKWVEVQYGDDLGAHGVLSAHNWKQHADTKEGPLGTDGRDNREAKSPAAASGGAASPEGRDAEGAGGEPAPAGAAAEDQRGGAGVGGGLSDPDGDDEREQPPARQAEVVTEYRKITKHRLTVGSNLVKLAPDAMLVSIGCQSGELCLWALAPDARHDDEQHFRRFDVLPTGMRFPMQRQGDRFLETFLGTAMMKDGTLACHVFEVPA